MNRPDEGRFTGGMPDRLAATAAAATALRCLSRFHECMTVVNLHDTAGMLAWTASVPSKAEIGASYDMLVETLTGSAIDSAAAQIAILALVENIVVDEVNQRIAVSPGDLAAAARLLRSLRDLAHDSVIGELVGDAMLGRSREPQLETAADITASTRRAGDSSPPARHPQSLLQIIENWHRLGDEIDTAPTTTAGERLAERADIEARIVASRARGDADLIAKAGALRRLLEQDGNAEDRLGRLTLSLLDDIGRIVGGEP
jgi:hypothetical protein